MDEQDKTEPTILTHLSSLGRWIQKQKVESKVNNKPWSFWFSLIMGALVLCSVWYSAYAMWRKGKKIASVQHELDKLLEEKIARECDQKVAKEEAIQKDLALQVQAAQRLIDKLVSDIIVLEQERVAEHEKINQITDWSCL